MTLLASTLPSNDGYVAAAYIVFFALILIYVAIMATRLSRVERKLRELQRTREQQPFAGGVEQAGRGGAGRGEPAHDDDLEREAV